MNVFEKRIDEFGGGLTGRGLNGLGDQDSSNT